MTYLLLYKVVSLQEIVITHRWVVGPSYKIASHTPILKVPCVYFLVYTHQVRLIRPWRGITIQRIADLKNNKDKLV